MSRWVIQHLPSHTTYVEPFGGLASILLRKERSQGEVINDLNDEICNLFRVLRDEAQAKRLMRQLCLTPYARREYVLSYTEHPEPVEQARRTMLRLHAAFAGDCHRGRMTGFKTAKGDKDPQSWARLPGQLEPIVERLRGVLIEQRPALDVLKTYDGPDTCFFVDPPYLPKTRTGGKVYRYEMTAEDHRVLLETLRSLRGKVVLAGYPSPVYDEELSDWRRVTRDTFALSHAPRREVLWLNPAAALENARIFDGEVSCGS